MLREVRGNGRIYGAAHGRCHHEFTVFKEVFHEVIEDWISWSCTIGERATGAVSRPVGGGQAFHAGLGNGMWFFLV